MRKIILLLILFWLLAAVCYGQGNPPDRIRIPCTSGMAQVRTLSNGNVAVTTCGSGALLVNGVPVSGGSSANAALDGFEVTSMFANFCAAVSSIAATETTLAIPSNITVASSCTVPETLALWFGASGRLTVSATKTITINGQILNAGGRKIFAGSGTVSLTANKTLESVNVKWFGAKGDGSTDDAANIQKCVTNSANQKIVFPSGTYIVSAQTNMVENTHIYLNKGAELKANASFPNTQTASIFYGEDIGNIYIDGYGTINCNHAARAANADRCTPIHLWASSSNYTIKNVILKNGGDDGSGNAGDGLTIRAGNNVSASAENVLIEGITSDGNERNGIQIYGCKNCRTTHNNLKNNRYYGIEYENAPNVVTANDIVTNGTTTVTSATINFNQFTVAYLPNMVIYPTNGGQFTSRIVSITNATTAVLETAPSFSQSGLRADVNSLGAEIFENVSFNDNDVWNNSAGGILIDGRNYTLAKNITVNGNRVLGNDNSGISVNGFQLEGFSATGNTIHGTTGNCSSIGTSGVGQGLVIASFNKGGTFTGNNISNNACSGVFWSGSQNVTFTGNTVNQNFADGITIRADTQFGEGFNILTSNEIWNNSKGASNTYSGVNILLNTGSQNAGVKLQSNNIGNNVEVYYSPTQKCGVTTDGAATENITMLDNTFAGNLTGETCFTDATLYPNVKFSNWIVNTPFTFDFNNASPRIAVNNQFLKGIESGGTTRNLIGIDSSNLVNIGNDTNSNLFQTSTRWTLPSANVPYITMTNVGNTSDLAKFINDTNTHPYDFLRFYLQRGIGFSTNSSEPTTCLNNYDTNSILLHACDSGFATYRDLRLRNIYLNGGTASTLLYADASKVITSLALTNGQLAIGSTGANPVAATLTAGNGVAVTNGAGSITVEADMAVLDSQYTSVGNVGTGEDDLMTKTLTAGIIDANGQSLRVRVAGKWAANANNKQFRLYVDGTAIVTSGNLAFNNGTWALDCEIMRRSSTTAINSCILTAQDSVVVAAGLGFSYVLQSNVTWANAIVIKMTGTATADNDITQEQMKIVREK